MKQPKKYIEIDCANRFEPLYVECGFGSNEEYESFILKQLVDKKAFLLKEIRKSFHHKRIVQEKLGPETCTMDEIKQHMIACEKLWLKMKRKEFEGNKCEKAFDYTIALPIDLDLEDLTF